jgi:hypothetical protein
MSAKATTPSSTSTAAIFTLPPNIEKFIEYDSGTNRASPSDTFIGNQLYNFHRLRGRRQRDEVYIDGGLGADTMQGSLQDDTYVVDNPDDRVLETGVLGGDNGNQQSSTRDEVRASVSFEAPQNVEVLTLLGSAEIDGWGNALDNILNATQNAAMNHLHGGFGTTGIRSTATTLSKSRTIKAMTSSNSSAPGTRNVYAGRLACPCRRASRLAKTGCFQPSGSGETTR